MFEDLSYDLRRFCSRTELNGWFNYRQANIDELEKLTKIHKEFFRNEWQQDTAEAAVDNDTPAGRGLVNLLEFDFKKKKPMADEQVIAGAFIFYLPSERGDLTTVSESLFKLLYEAANLRIGNLGEKANSAIMLFSAELLQWTKELGSRPCEESTLRDVKNRSRYLYRVLEGKVFNYEKPSDYQIQLLILKYAEILDKDVIPRIQWALNRTSARESFEKLKLHTEAYMRYTINGLFYLYSDLEGEDAKLYDSHSFKTELACRSSHISRFFDTPAGKVFSAISFTQKSSVNTDNEQARDINYFLSEDGAVRQEYLRNLIYKDRSSAERRVMTGIHAQMHSEKYITLLLAQLGALQDFSLFIEAFERTYELAGDGGNIMVYYALGQETGLLLSTFTQTCRRCESQLGEIARSCHATFRRFLVDGKDPDWQDKYSLFRGQYLSGIDELAACHSEIMKIAADMRKVQSDSYKNEVKDRIRGFKQLVYYIYKRMMSVTGEQPSLALPALGQTGSTHLLQGPEPQPSRQSAASSHFFFPVHASRVERLLTEAENAVSSSYGDR